MSDLTINELLEQRILATTLLGKERNNDLLHLARTLP